MARRCQVCGKRPQVGHKISHAHNVTKRRWMPNLQTVKIREGGTPKRITICTKCLKAGQVEKVL